MKKAEDAITSCQKKKKKKIEIRFEAEPSGQPWS